MGTGSIRDYIYAGSRLLSAVDKPTTSDPNSTCGIIVPGGAPLTVTAVSGQDQCFRFTGTAGRKVSARITAVSPTWFNGVWYLSILKPDGAPLGYPDGGCCGDIAVFADTRELPVTGEYRLIVDPYGAASGTFTIELFDVAHVTGPITANGPAVRVALTVPGQNAELTFSGTAGQTVSATITAFSPSIFLGNWYLWILKPDGSPLGGPGGYGFGCCGDPVAIRDAIVLPVDGTYKIVLDPTTTVPFGSFDLATQTLEAGTYTVIVDPAGANTGSLNLAVTTP